MTAKYPWNPMSICVYIKMYVKIDFQGFLVLDLRRVRHNTLHRQHRFAVHSEGMWHAVLIHRHHVKVFWKLFNIYLQVFQHSSYILIFLLMLLFGFTIITFAFMLTPFFDKARVSFGYLLYTCEEFLEIKYFCPYLLVVILIREGLMYIYHVFRFGNKSFTTP